MLQQYKGSATHTEIPILHHIGMFLMGISSSFFIVGRLQRGWHILIFLSDEQSKTVSLTMEYNSDSFIFLHVFLWKEIPSEDLVLPIVVVEATISFK